MFKDVEDAIITKVKGSALGPYLLTVKTFGAVSFKSVKEFALAAPGVLVSVLEGDVTPVAQRFQVKPDVLVWCIGQDLGRQDLKRTKEVVGAYALMRTVFELLSGQDLGLDIQQLSPSKFGYLKEDELTALGISVHWMLFSTGWTIQDPEEGEPTYIEKIGLEYFLKPGDDLMDAEDILDVS